METTDKPRAFVAAGRQAQIHELADNAGRARLGEARVCFLIGDAGSGKTSLIEYFCREETLSATDMVVAYGRAPIATGFVEPYSPFKAALSSLLSHRGATLVNRPTALGITAALENRVAYEIVEITAELGPDIIGFLFPPIGLVASVSSYVAKRRGYSLTGISQQFRESTSIGGSQPEIFEQFSKVLFELARKQFLILVLEDLQWFDEGSISLLKHLLQRSQHESSLRILFIVTCRTGFSEFQLRPSTAVDDLLYELRISARSSIVDMSSTVGGSEGWAFLSDLVDLECPGVERALLQELFHETAGHPLLATEVIKWLKRNALLTERDAGRWTINGPIAALPLPDSIEAVFDLRLAHLTAQERTVLNVAATQGELFSLETTAAVLAPQIQDVSKIIDDALQSVHGFCHFESIDPITEHRTYRFLHSLLQQYVYDQIPIPQKSALHLSLGEILESLYESLEAATPNTTISMHFERSGSFDRAALYAKRSADDFLAVYDIQGALRQYRRAQSMNSASQEVVALQCINGAAYCEYLLGRHRSARETLDEASLLRYSNVTPRVVANSYLISSIIDAERSVDVVSSSLQKALSLFDQANDAEGQARCLCLLSGLAYGQGDYSRAIEFARDAESLAEEHYLLRTRAEALIYEANCLLDLGLYDQAIKIYLTAKEIRRTLGDLRGEAVTDLNLGLSYVELGSSASAFDALYSALSLGVTIQGKRTMAAAYDYLGLAFERRGEPGSALDAFQHAFEIRDDLEDKGRISDSRAGLAQAFLDLRQVERAVFQVDRIIDAISDRGISGMEYPVRVLTVCAIVIDHVGDRDTAKDYLQKAVDLIDERLLLIRVPNYDGDTFRMKAPMNKQAIDLYARWSAR